MNENNFGKEFNYKIYSPEPDKRYEVIHSIYRGVTDEEDPKAIFEIQMDYDYLTKNVIEEDRDSGSMIDDIVKDMIDKRKEIEVRKEKEKENEIKADAIKEFCKYMFARNVRGNRIDDYFGMGDKFIKEKLEVY